MKKKRKIIQFKVTEETTGNYQSIIALCDDGTLWETAYSERGEIDEYEWEEWKELPAIPQE